MKKPLLIIIVVLALLVLLPVVNLLRWSFQAKKPLDIIVVDKTVPTFERLKHKSLFWVIKNNRFVDSEKRSSYSYYKDYYGFVPTRPEKSRLWDKNEYRLLKLLDIADSSDVLYIADTYGVFTNDWYFGSVKTRRSRKLYGGLNNNDNLLMKEMKDRNKLVIVESNSFEFPTVPFESQKIQERLGIEYTGWMGKYFYSLDTTTVDFPIWMTAMYRKQYKEPWTFSKSGVVLLSDKEIIVMEEGAGLVSSLPFIHTEQAYIDKWGLPESVPFDQWFEIISPINNNVISNFRLETSEVGEELLNSFGLSSSFPAAVQEAEMERTYYFSGDYTHYDVKIWASMCMNLGFFNSLLYSKDPNDTRRFFWLYYRPLIEGIFNDYYSSLDR